MKWLIAAGAIFVIMTVSLSVYLQPNSFSTCGDNSPDSTKDCSPAEAIVAVSGGDTSSRTRKAVEMYKTGWAPLIIFSGAAEDKNGPSNAAAMRMDAISQGIPKEAILVEEMSENTSQNAQETRDLLAAKQIEDIILVTSGYHQRRASIEFASYTAENNVEIRNAPTSDRDWTWAWWLTPRGWWLAIGEFGRIIALYIGGFDS